MHTNFKFIFVKEMHDSEAKKIDKALPVRQNKKGRVDGTVVIQSG